VKFVNQLPSKAQMVLKLFTLEGYGHQEIATQLNISVGTSKSQLNRAKWLLKSMIQSRNSGGNE
jgi:RNA polymerase sigma-70 factor (ECF subfamily)